MTFQSFSISQPTRQMQIFFMQSSFKMQIQNNFHWENYSLHFRKENNLTSMIQILRSGTFKSQQSTLKPTFHHKQMIQVPCSLDSHYHSIPAKLLVQPVLLVCQEFHTDHKPCAEAYVEENQKVESED